MAPIHAHRRDRASASALGGDGAVAGSGGGVGRTDRLHRTFAGASQRIPSACRAENEGGRQWDLRCYRPRRGLPGDLQDHSISEPAFASRRDASRSRGPGIFAEVDELRTRLAEVEERLDSRAVAGKADATDQLPGEWNDDPAETSSRGSTGSRPVPSRSTKSEPNLWIADDARRRRKSSSTTRRPWSSCGSG